MTLTLATIYNDVAVGCWTQLHFQFPAEMFKYLTFNSAVVALMLLLLLLVAVSAEKDDGRSVENRAMYKVTTSTSTKILLSTFTTTITSATTCYSAVGVTGACRKRRLVEERSAFVVRFVQLSFHLWARTHVQYLILYSSIAIIYFNFAKLNAKIMAKNWNERNRFELTISVNPVTKPEWSLHIIFI